MQQCAGGLICVVGGEAVKWRTDMASHANCLALLLCRGCAVLQPAAPPVHAPHTAAETAQCHQQPVNVLHRACKIVNHNLAGRAELRYTSIRRVGCNKVLGYRLNVCAVYNGLGVSTAPTALGFVSV